MVTHMTEVAMNYLKHKILEKKFVSTACVIDEIGKITFKIIALYY